MRMSTVVVGPAGSHQVRITTYTIVAKPEPHHTEVVEILTLAPQDRDGQQCYVGRSENGMLFVERPVCGGKSGEMVMSYVEEFD